MRKAVWIPAVTFVVLVAAVVGSAIAYDRGQRDTIAPGIAIGGVPVGGLTSAQARAKVQTALHADLDRDVVVRAGEQRFRLTAERIDRRVDVASLVAKAVAMSHRGGLVTRTLHSLKATPVRAELPVTVDYSKPAVRKFTARIGDEVDKQPVDATVTPDASGLSETPSREGVKVAESKLRSRLYAELAKPDGRTSMRAHLDPVAPAVTEKDLAEKYPSYIIVDRAHFTLRLYRGLKLDSTYTVAIGKQGLDTPAGLYDVQWREENPKWRVPDSDWAGDLAGTTIEPGPDNPIKARWMAFDGSAGIHGVDPSEYSSLGHKASHGCVRMRIPDVIDVYEKTDVGTPVYIA